MPTLYFAVSPQPKQPLSNTPKPSIWNIRYTLYTCHLNEVNELYWRLNWSICCSEKKEINNIFIQMFMNLLRRVLWHTLYTYLRCCKKCSGPGFIYKISYWTASIATYVTTYIWMSIWLHVQKNKFICMGVCLYTYVSVNLFREIILKIRIFCQKKNHAAS